MICAQWEEGVGRMGKRQTLLRMGFSLRSEPTPMGFRLTARRGETLLWVERATRKDALSALLSAAKSGPWGREMG